MSIDLDSAVVSDLPPVESEDDVPERTSTSARKPRSDKGKPRGPRGSGGGRQSKAALHKQIADDLLVPWAGLAAAASMAAPTMAGVMMRRGEQTADAIVKIAADHPRMMKALTTASKAGPMIDLGETLVMIVLGAAMDLGRIPPDNPMAAILGVTDVYAQVHRELKFATPEENNGTTPPFPTDPQQFAMPFTLPVNGPTSQYPPA